MRDSHGYRKLRLAVLKHLGNKCVRCGFSDYRALQVDHVNGDGASERGKYGFSMTMLWRSVLADTKGRYQLLCANCNSIKRFENKEHAFKYRRHELSCFERENRLVA